MITKKELLQLSQIHNTHCVSIFIPTHSAGEETLKGKDALNLKIQLKEIKSKLEGNGMSSNEIETFTKSINDLVNNKEFWRHQSGGLAIFLSDNVFQTYTLPIHFEEFNYLSNEFYLKPIIPLFNGDGLFYLLTLKQDRVNLYEGTRHSITEITDNDLIPSRLEDIVGYDYEEKSLQFRTQQGNKSAGSFHGHEDNDSKEKKELMQYFRAIDKGLMQILHDDQTPPLIICSLDYYFPIYQEVNTYQNLFTQHISGNPTDKDIFVLHEEAWELIEPYFNKTKNAKLDKFSSLAGSGKTSSDINELFIAAFEGKIDTLFIENKADVYGTYNPLTQEVKIEDVHKSSNVSLMNLLAIKVLENRGTVYLIEKDHMPVKSTKINGLFRY
ncbi:baeRF7 domain-containing protein [Peijinzhouia sedimentorum]